MFEEIENKPYYDDWTNPQLDPKSEQFRNAYNSVVNDYGKENADAQLKDWGIQFENEIEAGNVKPEQLPENSQIQKEAEQLYDSNPNNDEVRNDAVEDFVKQQFKDAQTIDWDKVKLYKPNEDPYYKVSDDFDWKNNPDHEPDFIEIKDKKDDYQKDEDFLGPDEYIDENGNIQVDPNWKPENADEDFLGPDEYIDENGNIQVDPNWKPENADEDFVGPDEQLTLYNGSLQNVGRNQE